MLCNKSICLFELLLITKIISQKGSPEQVTSRLFGTFLYNKGQTFFKQFATVLQNIKEHKNPCPKPHKIGFRVGPLCTLVF